MKNRLLVILIIVAAIFPFAVTAVELTDDLTAMAALGAMSLVTIAIAVAGILYRPKQKPEHDVPVQAIPTIKPKNATNEKGPTREASAQTKAATTTKTATNETKTSANETKRQRVR